jgi:hypothetical protein
MGDKARIAEKNLRGANLDCERSLACVEERLEVAVCLVVAQVVGKD